MKLYYCENYARFESFISPKPYIEQFYVLETEFGHLIEFDEDGKVSNIWENWSDFAGTWKDKNVFDRDFIKIRVL